MREETTREIQEAYSLLFEHLDIPSSENAALLKFLIEDAIARTKTPYTNGIGMGEQERSSRIAAIIGDAKFQQFLALEHNLSEYREVQKMGSVFQQRGVTLSDKTRDGLLEILVNVREQDKTVPGADSERGSIENLEYQLAKIDEYERLVIEQAQSVLSPKQVETMFERYQHNSYRRADVLEAQRQAIADNPDENLPLWYPLPND